MLLFSHEFVILKGIVKVTNAPSVDDIEDII